MPSPDQSRPPAPGRCVRGNPKHLDCNCQDLSFLTDPALPTPLMTDLERRLTEELADAHGGWANADAAIAETWRPEVSALRRQRDTLQAELAHAQQLMAAAFGQRDQYLTQLQKQRAVVEAIRQAWGNSYWDYDGAQTIDSQDAQAIAAAIAALDATEPYRNVLHTHQSGAHAAPDASKSPQDGPQPT